MTATDLHLQLIYEGHGRFHTASKVDLAIAADRFGQGEIIEARVGKKRSLKQHRWVFSMVKAAFDNQRAGPTFDDPERLRKWLLIQAGHCDVMRFPPKAITPPVAQWLRSRYDDIDFSQDGSWIYAKTARSMAIYGSNAIGHAEMTELADKFIDIIMTELVPGSQREDWEPFVQEARPTGRSPRNRKQGELRP